MRFLQALTGGVLEGEAFQFAHLDAEAGGGWPASHFAAVANSYFERLLEKPFCTWAGREPVVRYAGFRPPVPGKIYPCLAWA